MGLKKERKGMWFLFFIFIVTQVTRGRDQAHPVTPRFFMHVITITRTSNEERFRDLRSFI